MYSSNVRTSHTHPIQIATIPTPGGGGALGVTFCPGKKDPAASTGNWDRDLATDIEAIRTWGATAVVCLMEAHELARLEVPGLGDAVRGAGMRWFHLPIVDVDVPDKSFEADWRETGATLRAMLAGGQRVLVHCRGGLGRSGTIAAVLLVELGMPPRDAIRLVRKHRPGAIETLDQERYVLATTIAKASRTTRAGGDDRALGCLIGLAVGDALGTTLEFAARDSLPHVSDIVGGGPFRMKAGEWTDDTSMALCLADSLLEKDGLEPADLMERFRRWQHDGYNSVNGRCFDIGNTTAAAIRRYARTGEPLSGSADGGAAGNGSIMRLAPVPIFYRRTPEAAEEAANLQSRTTHGAAECVESCRLMTRVLVSLIDGASWEHATRIADGDFGTPNVKALARRGWATKTRSQIKSSGYVIDTLEAAMWAVDTTTDFRSALLLAVNLGDDADTVGAVTGQLAGARYGLEGIPATWRARLAWSDHMLELGGKLIAGPSGTRP